MKLNHICPFFGYQYPCLFELKKVTCRALHLETVREIFEIQREYYNKTKGAIEEEKIEELIADKEEEELTREKLLLYKGLLRNYPAKPSQEDILKVKRLKEDQEFQEILMAMREEDEGCEDEDDTF